MKKQMPWLRLYTEIIDDEKLRLISFQDRWHYIAILCCKRKGILDEPCSTDLRNRKVAIKLGLQVEELDQLSRRLEEVGLVVRETLQPTGWKNRQFDSDVDKTAAERKRKQREKEKKIPVTDKSRVTGTDVTPTDTEKDKEKETNKPARAGVAVLSDSPVAKVFAHWQATMNHPQSKLDHKRKAAISGRIREGYSAEDIMRAIDGCKASEWHQGKNDTGRVHDDIELICRDAKHLDQFIAVADRGKPGQTAPRRLKSMGDLLAGGAS